MTGVVASSEERLSSLPVFGQFDFNDVAKVESRVVSL